MFTIFMKSILFKSKSMFKPISFFYLSIIVLFLSCKTDDPSDISILPSNSIDKITIDKQGVKWFATDKGLVSFNGKTWKTYPNVNSLNKPILDVFFDIFSVNSQLLVGTNEGALDVAVTSQNITVNNIYRQTSNQLLNDTVFSIATDNKNARYFGTPNGLSILKNSVWTSYDGRWGNKSADNFLTKMAITAIVSAKNGWNYVSTKGGGVSRFKYADAVSGATKYFQPWAYGLKSDTVFTVIIVNDSCQWYGTTKGAAYHTSHNTKADWTSYSIANGLVSDTVYAIAQAVDGSVWFGTHRGVSIFKNDSWTNFTTKDGLIANKVNTLAIDTDGSVWFGTDEGISQYKQEIWKSFRK